MIGKTPMYLERVIKQQQEIRTVIREQLELAKNKVAKAQDRVAIVYAQLNRINSCIEDTEKHLQTLKDNQTGN